jgi:L-amino acid N-acyltransferase YncA
MGDRSRVVALPDRRTVTVRPATRADVDGLARLYESLSAEDRRRRFFTRSDPPLALLERFVDATERDGLWLVAVTDDGDVVADGGYTIRADGDAEFALTVAKPWRGGLGSYLLDALRSDAADHGVHNLRADILLENRPMLRLVARRGYATVDQPDWAVVNVTMSTGGGRPAWPPVHDRPRLLVEGCGGHWHAAAEAWAAGWDVVTCAGPCSRSVPVCPVLEGKPCPLVEGADLVVVAVRPTDPSRDGLLDGHLRAGSTPSVLDESTLAPDGLSRRLTQAGRRPLVKDQEVHDEHPRHGAPA